MIIKYVWSETIWDIKWFKIHKNESWYSEEGLELYVQLVILILGTPLVIALDLLLLPFEIGYYFFKKWTNQD